MSSIELVLKIAVSVLASVTVFLIGVVFLVAYLLITATVATARWFRDVWRRSYTRPRNHADAPAAVAPSEARRAAVA